MGYYTDYKLTVNSTDINNEEFLSTLQNITDYEDWYQCGDHLLTSSFRMSDVKWYDHEEHMRELSLNYPDVLFELDGEGEKSGDIWKLYAKNGKLQECRAEIVFEDFDEAKLS